MPNHVHVLIETAPGHPLSDIVHSWKSFTANQANKVLERQGPLWQREYHDRFMHDAKHLQRTIEYIEENPVHAGLAPEANAWLFSSARLRGDWGRSAGWNVGEDKGNAGKDAKGR